MQLASDGQLYRWTDDGWLLLSGALLAVAEMGVPLATEAKQDTTIAALDAVNAELDTQTARMPSRLGTKVEAVAWDAIAHYSSAAGGRVAYNVTTDILTINTGGEVDLAAFVNPATSSRDVVIDLAEFGASASTTSKRYRGSTITVSGSARTASNMGGGTASPVARFYAGGGSPTYTRSGGSVTKATHIATYSQNVVHIGGRTRLRPGETLAWTIQGPGGLGGSMTASVYLEWFEINSES